MAGLLSTWLMEAGGFLVGLSRLGEDRGSGMVDWGNADWGFG